MVNIPHIGWWLGVVSFARIVPSVGGEVTKLEGLVQMGLLFIPPSLQISLHAFKVKEGKAFIGGRNIGLGGLICGGILGNLDEHPLVLCKTM
jgi:hypothetical protein